MNWKQTLPCLCYLIFIQPSFAVEITMGKDAQSHLPYWQINNQHMSLRFVQRLPDQSRAYFMARGFSKQHAEEIALSCAFQTIFKNTSTQNNASPLRYSLNDWIINVNKTKHFLKTREAWAKEWKTKKIKSSAKIAFKWALLPTDLQYEPGDYNWGMTFFNLKPGEKFDLIIKWQQSGKNHQTVLHDLQCAPDIHPSPEDFLN